MTDTPENCGFLSRKKLKIAVVVIAAILILALIALLLIGILGYIPTRLLPGDKIEESISDCNKSYPTVRRYLKAYGFGNLKMQKLEEAENYFSSYYLRELDEPRAIAEKTARLFLDNYYDPETGEYTLDSTDRDAVTDAVLRSYVAAVGDDYTVYRTYDEYLDYHSGMSGSYVGIGVSVLYDKKAKTLTVTDVTPGSSAERGGVLPGDLILKVDGVSVESVGYPDCTNLIRGKEGTGLVLTVLREESEISMTLTREAVIEQVVQYSITDGNFGYVKITRFKENTDEQLEEALGYITEAGVLGIIFDLRGNTGGYLDSAVKSLSLLVPEGTPIVSYSYKNSGERLITSDRSGGVDVPIAVLCDENTASAGELFTAAVRDWRDKGLLSAVIIGETTFGKGVMQSTFKLSDGSALTLTVAYYNPPSGNNYDGEGIDPDVPYSVSDSNALISAASAKLTELINVNNN